MNGKYDWLTLTTADMGYPMEILYGDFYNEKDEPIASIPSNMELSSQWWSGDSGVMITGDEYKEIPARMKIRWFSYAEDKFYEGDFAVDKERITQLFDKGIEFSKPSSEYNYIKVAIATAGQVYLYLVGGNNVLVGTFVAKEVFVDDFKKEMGLPMHTEIKRDELIKIVLKNIPLQTQQEIAENRISTQIWKDINLHYPWQYTFEIEDDNRPLFIQKEKLGADFINNEDAWAVVPEFFTTTIPKAIPLEIDAKFKTKAGRKLIVRIYPGNVNGQEPQYQTYEVQRGREQELVKLFKEFYKEIGSQEFAVHLRISEDVKTAKVFLKKGNIEREIPNVEIQLFDTTFD
ncbi:DUF2931 family protein [Empedobacter tilapiae]